jgi:hypothetical protein
MEIMWILVPLAICAGWLLGNHLASRRPARPANHEPPKPLPSRRDPGPWGDVYNEMKKMPPRSKSRENPEDDYDFLAMAQGGLAHAMPPQIIWPSEIEATDEDRKLLGELEQALAGWAPDRVGLLFENNDIFDIAVRTKRRQDCSGVAWLGIGGFVAKVVVFVRAGELRSVLRAVIETSARHPDWVRGGEGTPASPEREAAVAEAQRRHPHLFAEAVSGESAPATSATAPADQG